MWHSAYGPQHTSIALPEMNLAEPESKFRGVILPTLVAALPGAGTLFSHPAITETPDNIASGTGITTAILFTPFLL
jgi:hypothetical protein